MEYNQQEGLEPRQGRRVERGTILQHPCPLGPPHAPQSYLRRCLIVPLRYKLPICHGIDLRNVSKKYTLKKIYIKTHTVGREKKKTQTYELQCQHMRALRQQ